MNTKVNLSEAAKEILQGTVMAKRGERDQERAPKGQVGKDTLSPSDTFNKTVGKIGHSPDDHDDELPDFLKGVPTATPPGATPPVGAMPMEKLASQPQQTMGRGDLVKAQNSASKDETSYDDVRDRVGHNPSHQQMATNSGGVGIQKYESVELSDEEKATRKELHETKMRERMAEDIAALVDGENLSEAFVTKATTIFEAAVMARASDVIAEAETELTEQFESALVQIKEDLASKVDDYLNYMVEEWMKENEIAIEKGLRAEIVEDFVSDLRDVFIRHNIDIPADKVDVVTELTDKVTQLEVDINEEIKRSIELKKILSEQKKSEAIHAACDGLMQTQVEKLKSLAEGVEYTTEEEFTSKIKTLKDSYFKSDVVVASPGALDEPQIEDDKAKNAGPKDALMEAYAGAISKTVNK